MAGEAKEMFEKALAINPDNDSTKIGLGSCYLFGNISENPMQGIQMIREVADRDTTNMFAQFMLGLETIERLAKECRSQRLALDGILKERCKEIDARSLKNKPFERKL
jgi:hypothetical protein